MLGPRRGLCLELSMITEVEGKEEGHSGPWRVQGGLAYTVSRKLLKGFDHGTETSEQLTQNTISLWY